MSRCGDGVLNPVVEECDDGNEADDGNGCDPVCRKSSACGNGILEEVFEACDGEVGCSPDCSSAILSLTPLSDAQGIEFDQDGVFSVDDDATGATVHYSPADGFGDAEEGRLAWEFDTSRLRPGYLVRSAQLTLFTSNFSGDPQALQLHSYRGNGIVEVVDMVVDRVFLDLIAFHERPIAVDVKPLAQRAADERFSAIGFMLRLASRPSRFFQIAVTLSENSDQSRRPRLDLYYCVDPDGDGSCE